MKPQHVRFAVVPVAGAALLGGVLWMSGIPLSNAGDSHDGVRLESEGSGATLVVSDLEAGDAVSRTVSITNPSTQPTRLSMTEHGDPPSGSDAALQLVVEREGVRLYSGPFGAMSDVEADQGWIPAGGRVTFTFTVSLADDALDVAGSSASLGYTWETAAGNGPAGAPDALS
jgi:hypothetical protein